MSPTSIQSSGTIASGGAGQKTLARGLQSPMCRGESGFVIVFFVIASFALLALVALSIGLGIVATGSTRLQQAANLASLAALKEYIDKRADPANHPPRDLADFARDRANFILGSNDLALTNSSLGGLRLVDETETVDTGGLLEPGSYFSEDPDGTGPLTPCDGPPPAYPCFKPVDSATFEPENPFFPVNAVRVLARNAASNPIIVPIASILGQENSQINSSVTASLAQRCVAFVLDVSLSTTDESHKLPSGNLRLPYVSRPWDSSPETIVTGNDPDTGLPYPPWVECDAELAPPPPPPVYLLSPRPGRVLCPNNSAMFAMLTQDLHVGGGLPDPQNNTTTLSWCNLDNNGAILVPGNNSGLVWCNLAMQNGGFLDRGGNATPLAYPVTPGGAPQILKHYRQHYLDRGTPYGYVRIDHVNNPEPLSTFLTAFNAGLRLIQLQTTGADGAMVVPFGKVPMNVFPADTALDKVERNLSFLVQTTNYLNRGTITNWETASPYRPVTSPPGWPPGGTFPVVPGELHPNYIDMGWFPVDRTNNRDTDIIGALKFAIDRLADINICPASAQKSIVLATDGLMTCDTDPVTGVQSCPAPKDHTSYLSAVENLIGPGVDSIRNKLTQSRIALTTLLRGELVQPNFKFALSPSGSGHATLRELWAQSSRDRNAAKSLVEYTQLNGTSEEDAYEKVGEKNSANDTRIFRDPNWVFTYLSLDSGGLMCPLLDICTPAQCPACGGSCYEPDGSLSPCAQWPSTFYCAPREWEPSEQAARCVQQTVGGNPYILVSAN